MAFIYSAGLRIRVSEPMPECLAGESPQDYFRRVLEGCTIESATTAENASGDSSPSPFNIGQIQSDLAQALAAIATLGTEVGTQTASITALQEGYATGVGTYAIGATSVTISFPSDGVWRIPAVTGMEQALANVFISDITINSAKINFDAAAAAGSLHWSAFKST